MDTETIDRLFLELSQFTQATTGKELALRETVMELTSQLAAEKEARVKAERERDEWKAAFDREIEGNRTVALTIGGQRENEPFRSFLKRVGEERKTAESRVKELESELKKVEQKIVEDQSVWLGEIANEHLAGNIVKEHYAKGVLNGLQIALDEFKKGPSK